MAKPILEKITDEIILRLGEITVANGYEFTAVSAELVERGTNTWQPAPLKIKVEYGEINENEELSCVGVPYRQAFDAVYEISGYAEAIDRDEDEVGMINPSVTDTQMIAAIRKALVESDGGGWHLFDGNAIDARITASETFDAPGYDGGRVMLMVTYRTAETDPYTVA